MKVGIVIVNYRTSDMVMNCVDSISLTTESIKLNICIVDNFSNDDSPLALNNYIKRNNFEDRVSIIESKNNLGFAGGCNLAMKKLKADFDPDFYWLLNPDAEVKEKALNELLVVMHQDNRAGIAGSRLENRDGSERVAAFRFQSMATEFASAVSTRLVDRLFRVDHQHFRNRIKPTKCDWVSGASFLVRSEVFSDIGMLDEAYFLYYEEMDFCFQATIYDWSIYHVPSSRVIHIAGSSSGINAVNKPLIRRPQYWFESRRRYFVKNFGRVYAFITDVFWVFGHIISRFKNKVMGRKMNLPPHYLRDFWVNSSIVNWQKLK